MIQTLQGPQPKPQTLSPQTSFLIQLPSRDTSQVWMAAEVHWLLWAYLLEFRQLPVRPAVWVASCLFLLAHINVLREVRRGKGPKAHAA